MRITEYETYIQLEPEEGYVIVERGASNITGATLLYLPLGSDLTRYTEVLSDRIPYELPEIDDIESYNLITLKEHLIQLSKDSLQYFMDTHPITLNIKGTPKKYSISSANQIYLNSLIAAAEDAISLGISFIPMWNDVDGYREPWDLQELKTLRVAIQSTVIDLVTQQQHIEGIIQNCSNKEDLLNVDIGYHFGQS